MICHENLTLYKYMRNKILPCNPLHERIDNSVSKLIDTTVKAELEDIF